MIRVSVYGNLRQLTKEHELEASADSIKNLIEALATRFGEEFKKSVRAAKIFHNGKNVAFSSGVKTKLNPGDQVVFLSPVAGG